MRFILPIILIGITITAFFLLINPMYEEISTLRLQVASYNEALNNSKALENERDKLTKKFNSIDPVNLEKLEKLLPNNVDNIRLILEIEKIASPYGMVLKDVRYNTKEEDNTKSNVVQGGQTVEEINLPYGVWDLEFSTEGSYTNFLNFLRDMENNLRIVDVSSIGFSSLSNKSQSSGEAYEYKFKIKTYWMKN